MIGLYDTNAITFVARETCSMTVLLKKGDERIVKAVTPHMALYFSRGVHEKKQMHGC